MNQKCPSLTYGYDTLNSFDVALTIKKKKVSNFYTHAHPKK